MKDNTGSELAALLAEAQAEADDEVTIEFAEPESLEELWFLADFGARKLDRNDITPELVSLAEEYLRGYVKERRFNKNPFEFLDEMAKCDWLTDGQAKGVLNTLIAAMRSQRKRWANQHDGARAPGVMGYCLVCGDLLEDPKVIQRGVGSVCWRRLCGNWDAV
jgi:hypothetical protein